MGQVAKVALETAKGPMMFVHGTVVPFNTPT